MFDILKPKLYVDSIYQIDFEKLKNRGIKGVVIDLDNTITEWNNPELPKKAFDWFTKMKDHDLKACLASNNNESRVVIVAAKLGIPYIAKANKPRSSAFKKAMEKMGTDQKNTAVIGDQIFTDILGGNRLGLFTILVVPLNTKEFIGTRFVRIIERKVLKGLVPNK